MVVTFLIVPLLLPYTIAAPPPTLEQVRKEVVRQAVAVNFNKEVALNIAECESSFKWDAKNPSSTASGVYQFTDPTWKFIKADNTQLDYKENIRQFIKWFPLKPGWWKECTKKYGY